MQKGNSISQAKYPLVHFKKKKDSKLKKEVNSIEEKADIQENPLPTKPKIGSQKRLVKLINLQAAKLEREKKDRIQTTNIINKRDVTRFDKL